MSKVKNSRGRNWKNNFHERIWTEYGPEKLRIPNTFHSVLLEYLKIHLTLFNPSY